MKKTVRVVAALLFVFTCIFCMKTASTVKAEETKYNLWLGEVQVTSANKDNIPGVVGGTASYDPVKHVLNFSGTVTGVQGTHNFSFFDDSTCLIYCKKSDLTITGTFTPSVTDVNSSIFISEGALTIEGSSTNIIVSSKSNSVYVANGITLNSGSLKATSMNGNPIISFDGIVVNGGSILAVSNSTSSPINVYAGDLYINGGSVETNGGKNGISSEYGHFYINGGSVYTDRKLFAGGGIDIDPSLCISQPLGGKISEDGTTIVEHIGKISTKIAIENGESIKYNVWVGKHQVTGANKDNIPGIKDGIASYNPATNELKFEDVTGVDGSYTDPDEYWLDCLVYSSEPSLTVTGNCDISDSNVTVGIKCKGDLIIDGNINMQICSSSAWYGLYSEKTVKIQGGHVNIYAPDGDAIISENIKVTDGFLEAYGETIALHALENINFDGGYVKATADDKTYGYAAYAAGDISFASEVKVREPENGIKHSYGSGYFLADSSKNIVPEAEVGVEQEGYNVMVMGTPVNNINRFDIPGFDSGIVSFDPNMNTLNFDDVSGYDSFSNTDPLVESYIDGLTITGNADLNYEKYDYGFHSPLHKLVISGDFYIHTKSYAILAKEVVFLSGNGSYSANDYGGVSVSSSSVSIIDGHYYFEGKDKAFKTNDEFNLDSGEYILYPDNAAYNNSISTVAQGTTPAKSVEIGPEVYDLKIGGVQITSKNCKNLPGVYYGSAYYNPDTKTLYWSDSTILKYNDTNTMIQADDELTISGRMHINNKNAYCGIRCKKLTLDSIIYVTAGTYGTYVTNDLGLREDSYLESEGLKDGVGCGIYCKNINCDINSGVTGEGASIGVEASGSISIDYRGFCYGTGNDFGIKVGNDFSICGDVCANSKGKAIYVGGTVKLDPSYGIVKRNDYDIATSATHLSDDKKQFLTADNNVAKKVEIGDLYFIFVGNEKITIETKDNIKGLKSGKGSYDLDTHTLYLENAEIVDAWETCIDTYDDLNIVTKGDVKITSPYGYGIDIFGKLTIDGNFYVEADEVAISANDFELKNGSVIVEPEGGKFDKEKRCIVDKNGNRAKKVRIEKKADATPAPGSTPTPGTTPEPGTVSPGNTIADVEAFILALPNDNDPAGSDFATLQAKASKVTKNSIKLTWKKVANATSYYIYGNKCGTKNKYKKIKVVSKTTFTQKKLKKGTYYKYLIVAVDKHGKVLSTSKTIHAATTGGKVGNAKSLTTKAKKNKVTLKKGKTFKLKAKQKAASKKLKVKKHRAIQYESTNAAVATVNTNGKIKAVGKGKCDIYVYAQNGITKKIKVTVK